MPRNSMSIGDLENFLSSRRSAPSAGSQRIASFPPRLPSVTFAEGGPVGTRYPRLNGGLSKAAGALRRAEQERQFRKSVFSQPREEQWVPEYQKEPSLEPPMISPDDLIGSGIPTKIAMAIKGAAPMLAGMGVIKNKGGNWLTGSVEDALSGLKRATNIDQLNPEMRAIYEQYADPAALRDVPQRNAALNSFIDKQLTRYVKNEMATPEDPIRAMAERGVLHFEPGAVAEARRTVHPSGEVFQTLGQSPLAKAWEQTSDRFIAPETAGRFKVTRGQDGTTTVSRNPWLEKLPNDATVYDLYESSRPSSLGFSHLTDELANALNPESGLPRHLLLDPKSMDRVSVPQAVERVSQINAWRAAQKAEADLLRANNAATVLHKDYPDKGFKWVELRKQDLPEGWVQEGAAYANPADPKAKWVYPEESLRDALKYEGDTMGHCVGGYCDDVASGRSRIYSLRDAKGQPHVTIEVRPPRKDPNQAAKDFEAEYGRPPKNLSELEDWNQVGGGDYQTSIVQIKGKANRAPNEEYLPFVQDFVRSGKWSDVGDFHNTGLMKLDDFKYGGMDPMFMEAARKELGDFPTMDELTVFKEKFDKGFANGGSVDKNNLSVQQLQAIIAQINQEHINAA